MAGPTDTFGVGPHQRSLFGRSAEKLTACLWKLRYAASNLQVEKPRERTLVEAEALRRQEKANRGRASIGVMHGSCTPESGVQIFGAAPNLGVGKFGNPPALGAGERRFKSGRPDQNSQPRRSPPRGFFVPSQKFPCGNSSGSPIISTSGGGRRTCGGQDCGCTFPRPVLMSARYGPPRLPQVCSDFGRPSDGRVADQDRGTDRCGP